MKQLVFLFFLLASLAGHAQPATWNFVLPLTDPNAGMDVATGPDGSTYLTGRFTGTLQLGATQLTSTGTGPCLFIAKCSPGGQVLRVTKLEGATDVLPNGIAVDAAGNSYVTGYFLGTLTYNRHQTTTSRTITAPGTDVFLLKCGPDGRVRWLSQADGGPGSASAAGPCAGQGVAVDRAGNSYITGQVTGADIRFDGLAFGSRQRQGFVASYDRLGQLRWAKVWEAPGQEFATSRGNGVAVDAAGDCYVSGPNSRGWQLDGITFLNPTNTVFLAKFGTRHGQLLWARTTPGQGDGRALDTDKKGNVYLGDTFSGSTHLDKCILTSTGDVDGFVACLTPQGAAVWATPLGTANYDVVSDLVIDQKSGQVFTTGFLNFTAQGTNYAFLAQLNAHGQVQQLAQVSGPGTSSSGRLAVDGAGNVYSTGVFTGSCGFGPVAVSSAATQGYFGRYGHRVAGHPNDNDAAAPGAPAEFSFFPNPAQGQLTLRLANLVQAGRATLYNHLGRAVAERTIQPTPAAAADVIFDTTALPDGLYTLRLESNEKVITRLITVQH